jgi:1-acyl-sn-glycerol-3-phosphate acyltransferase/uncharacterized protein with GYD domain
MASRIRSSSLVAEVEAAKGRIVSRFVLFEEWDFCSVVDLPNNAAALLLGAAHGGAGGVERMVLPAIELPLFQRLLGQTTETTGPHRWQIHLPARLARRAMRPFLVGRYRWRYFRPFQVIGRENLDGFNGPAVFIANHSSHYDMFAFIEGVPSRFRDRLYFGSAADRWYIKGRTQPYKQGWWRSLFLGCFPIQRAGGGAVLDYPEWLIEHGNSIGIFPEGTRTRNGRLSKFRPGAALLAQKTRVPVVPMYFGGLYKMLPPGSQNYKAGRVTVHIGKPFDVPPGVERIETAKMIRDSVEALEREATIA